MLVWVLSFVSACTDSPTPVEPAPPTPAPIAPSQQPFRLTETPIPGFPDLRTSTQQQLQLDRLPARWKLGDAKLPPKVEGITDEFVIHPEEVPNPKGAHRELMVIRAPLPFPVETDEQTFRPEGMIVSVDGHPIPFGRGPAPQAKRSTWRINGKFIVMSHPELPAEGTVKVRYEGVREALDRHDPKRAGPDKTAMAPEDYVRYDVTLKGQTRHGLLLPAPTIGEWDVTLPETRATFEGWLALEKGPIDHPKSDGASIALTVTVDGRETAVDTQDLMEFVPEFRQWRVDLSQWAGKSVKLKLVTDPRGTTVFDWVFVGSPTVWGPPKGDVRRVVVVALDTTRPDHLSFYGYDKPTTPEFDGWAKSGISFDRTWSTAPRTRPSFRSSTTGRLPLEAVGATNIAEVFAEHGFATAGLAANVHLQPRFSFDDGFDSWAFDGKATATDEVDRALAWLDANQEVDSYLFVHFMDPHMAYDPPQEFRDRFVKEPDPDLPNKTKRSEVLDMMKAGTLDDLDKQTLEGLHDGELAYLSHELGRMFDAIDRMPGRTLVVVHSDHGEEFWEHGGFEHNHSLYDELTRTVLVFRPRGGLPEGRRLETPATLMDIAPTLYDLYGFETAPETDGSSLMPLLAGSTDWPDRALPVGYLQYSHERWGLVWNNHKYMIHTGTGKEELYDLVADPGETKDVSEGRDLAPYRERLHEAHGLEVGPGWRIRIDLAPKGPPLKVELPAAARLADVLDPESVVEHRANIEWGELPKRLPFEIGKVELSADKKTLTFTPGREPEGVLYVVFDAATEVAGAKVWLGEEQLPLIDAKRGRLWKNGDRQVLLDPGTVVVPPPSEADRMGIGPKAAGGEDDMEMLCSLGYVTEGCPGTEGEDGAAEPEDEEEFQAPEGDG
ncbi:MAG: sulfatase [Myxococcota bacterium]